MLSCFMNKMQTLVHIYILLSMGNGGHVHFFQTKKKKEEGMYTSCKFDEWKRILRQLTVTDKVIFKIKNINTFSMVIIRFFNLMHFNN